MANPVNFPCIESHLPDLMEFVTTLAQEFEHGKIDSWQNMTDKLQWLFTTQMMEQVDAVVPGWRKMSSYAEGVTLVHVVCVFTGLLLTPEYHRATATQRALMKWIVLFHDLAKVVQAGHRDHTHGFRSATMSAEILPGLGFAVANNYESLIGSWIKLTTTAVIRSDNGQDYIQDNSKLAEIIAGIEKLFGRNTPANLIVKTVLLHMSLDVVQEWPQSAPLSKSEIRMYIDPELCPLLKMMMLADNDGWTLFDPPIRARYRQETLAAFEAVDDIIDSHHSPS